MRAAKVAEVSLGAARVSDTERMKKGRSERVLVLRLKGTAVGKLAEIPRVDSSGTTEGMCFDMDLYDVAKNKKVGTARDRLSDVREVGDGLALVGTAYFNLPSG